MEPGTPTARPARRRRGEPSLARWLVAVLLALGTQGLFGVLTLLSLGRGPAAPRPAVPPREVALRPLSAEEWERNRGQPRPTPERPAPPKRPERKKPPEPPPRGQVVDVAPGNRQEDPEAKYVAESSKRVDKETRARDQTPFYRNAMPQRTAPQPPPAQAPTGGAAQAGNDGRGRDERPARQGGQGAVVEVPDTRRRSEIALRPDPSERSRGPRVDNRSQSDELRGNSDRLRLQPGTGPGGEAGSEGRQGPPGLVHLLPSAATMDRIVGAAPNDRLEDVEEGEATFLNTREWKYASFFNRVKQSVGMHWSPATQLQRRDPTGDVYGGRDRYTLLEVTLGADGRVRDIKVEKSSGLDFLDGEAVASFERAQPFPNPPRGLLSGDDTVKFSFGFFLEFGGGPRLRLFRQPN